MNEVIMIKTGLFICLLLLLSLVTKGQTTVNSSAVTSENCGSVRFTDERDGKSYGTLKVGDQCWMAEDLRFGTCSGAVFRRYHRVSVSGEIAPGYWGVCREGRDVGSGYLYNWQGAMNLEDAAYGGGMVSDSSALAWRGICPEGWFLPRGGKGGDFQQLSDAFGGSSARLRSQSAGSFGGTLAGFTLGDSLHHPGRFGYYWSRNAHNSLYSFGLFLDTAHVNPVYDAPARMAGLTVRCIRDISRVTVDGGSLTDVERICAGDVVTFTGSPATANGVAIGDYEWSVKIGNGAFTVIPGEEGATLSYTGFEKGKTYVFKRKAICPFGEAEAISKSYSIPNTATFAITPTVGTLDACGNATRITASGAGSYSWTTPTGTSTGNTYTPKSSDFISSGTFSVSCTSSVSGCVIVRTFNITVKPFFPQTFKVCGDAVLDCQGNSYTTKQMADGRCWMTQNLRRTDIAYTYPDNSVSNAVAHGCHYNWTTAMQGSTTELAQGICPEGWHIPCDGEWKTLEMAYGMTQAQADGTLWRGTDQGTQFMPGGSSGFNMTLSGFNGTLNFGTDGYCWSSSDSVTGAWFRSVYSSYASVYRTRYGKTTRSSVRCVRD